jgi:hypothetical protein
LSGTGGSQAIIIAQAAEKSQMTIPMLRLIFRQETAPTDLDTNVDGFNDGTDIQRLSIHDRERAGQ